MKRLLRPVLLLALSGALVGGAVLAFRGGPSLSRPVPLPVAAGTHEIVWLYAATNASNWERFVAATERLEERFADLAVHTTGAFPPQTTAVPEVVLSWPAEQHRLVFRWYKLTSDWKTRDWIAALANRQPPPLAVIGGSTSDAARDLAFRMRAACAALPPASRPLLLLTTATADRVPLEEGVADLGPDDPDEPYGIALNRVYPGRTFRFCFTNRQMAGAVTQFLGSQPDLRPDTDPFHMVKWDDDSYSRDLIDGFGRALRHLVAPDAARDWSFATGLAAGGFPPTFAGGAFPLDRLGKDRPPPFRLAILPPTQLIDSSVGDFLKPNRYEMKVAADLLDQVGQRRQNRPLLVVTGQSAPTRRFLHALALMAPEQTRRFVVATGDGVSFNSVYRDRQVAWPIQDLPCKLVFFCHHNPVDAGAGFRPESDARGAPAKLGSAAATGTEDVLLYTGIVEALVQAFHDGGVPCANAGALAERMAVLRLEAGRISSSPQGRLLFSDSGNRLGSVGEHVVCVRPRFMGVRILSDGTRAPLDPDAELTPDTVIERVLPEATIEVWAWGPGAGGAAWQRKDRLTVPYYEGPREGGTPDGRD
jgi:hypothetical protein